MTTSKGNEQAIYRSSKSGRIVTKRYAAAHPSTTQRERRPAKTKRSRAAGRKG